MKVMSFNIEHGHNYITKKIDYEAVAQAIRDCDADIVGLNEVRGDGPNEWYDAQTEILSRLTGLEHYYFAEAIYFKDRGPYGNCILSRYPIASAEVIPIPEPAEKAYDGYYEDRCLLKVKLETGVTIIVIHFGLNPDEHENDMNAVLENLEDEKCILMGDFNILPENELFIPLKKRMKDVADVFDNQLLSWPSDNPERKIDYIFVSNDVEIVNADIPAIIVSDHRPHIAEIKLKEE